MALPHGSRSLLLPATELLASEIPKALRTGSNHARFLKILRRTPNPYATSYPTEIVTCLLADGTKPRVLCKYDVELQDSPDTHRGGVEYEAMVYRDILVASKNTAPRYYGTFVLPTEGVLCLVTEYVDSALRFDQMAAIDAVPRVASWLGAFHRKKTAAVSELAQHGRLRRYDEDYYLAWANRTMEITRRMEDTYSWLRAIRNAFGDLISLLVTKHVTIVHGEFYPSNVLLNPRGVFPVDWENAAIAAGEVDVAAAIEGWRDREASEFEQVYRRARWPDTPIDSTDATLDAARLYWYFRWLGDRAEWSRNKGSERTQQRFHSLMRLAVRMGIL